MQKESKNFAFIDGANLHKGVEALGWKLNYKKFRIWLSDKYHIKTAYLFLGLVSKHKDLYTSLQEAGYTLVFKETTHDGDGKVKGNCDADLVLKAAVEFYEKNFEKAVIVSSDGDYASLVKFLSDKNSLLAVVSPGLACSYLLKKLNVPIVDLSSQCDKLHN